jgi:hypothetical protein
MKSALRIEPDGAELLEAYPKCRKRIEKAGWLPFFLKYSGHNSEVTKAFTLGFDGSKEIIGDLELTVSEDSIAQET